MYLNIYTKTFCELNRNNITECLDEKDVILELDSDYDIITTVPYSDIKGFTYEGISDTNYVSHLICLLVDLNTEYEVVELAPKLRTLFMYEEELIVGSNIVVSGDNLKLVWNTALELFYDEIIKERFKI